MSDTIREFADSLCLTEIVSQTDMHAILEETDGGIRDTQELSKKLTERGLISAFQAERLEHGEPLVIDEYVLLQEIGAGGMGRVFKARHPPMARTVVIKIIKEQHATAPDAVNRFNREIKAIANLDHPNIVRAYHSGMYRGSQYLVMEYVEGEDLAQHARNHGALSVTKVVDYLIQAATGLAHAHQQGIVHRDVKPGNLMLDADGRIRVLDLGLAKPVGILASDPNDATDAMTGDCDIVGTSAYMPPEQSQNTQDVDHRSDIYSLGCTLHYLLTCEPVYSGTTAIERIIAHRTEEPPCLRDSRDDVPPELEAVFHKMIAKRPDDRFQSMDDVIEALQQAIKLESEEAQEASASDESIADRPTDRSGFRIGVVVAAGVLVTSLLLSIPFWFDPDPPAPDPTPTTSENSDEPSENGRLPVAGDSGEPAVEEPVVPNDRSGTAPRTEREIAVALIEAGATIDIQWHDPVEGEKQRLGTSDLEDLPDEQIQVIRILLERSNFADAELPLSFGDQDLTHLKHLHGLTYLSVAFTSVTSKGIESIAQCPSLVHLYLGRTQVDDSAMAALADLPNLETLDLQGTIVTDAGLGELERSANLKTLQLGEGQRVTDIGLESVARVTTLRSLTLRYAEITDFGLSRLAGLENLEKLDLSNTDTDDAGLEAVCQIRTLTELTMRYTSISDDGVRFLPGLEQLQYLDLSNTEITNQSIPHFSQISNLNTLLLDNTEITIEALNELYDKHPNLRVE